MTDRQMLVDLVKAGHRFRSTPIIDDDFVSIKNEFDALLSRAIRHLEQPQVAPIQFASGPLTFANLRVANVARCENVFHPLNSWSPMDWACAVAGEVGEACNAAKKLRRFQDGTPDPGFANTDEARLAIVEEIADTVIYADLFAARVGGDLGEMVVRKFNAVSDKRGSQIKL